MSFTFNEKYRNGSARYGASLAGGGTNGAMPLKTILLYKTERRLVTMMGTAPRAHMTQTSSQHPYTNLKALVSTESQVLSRSVVTIPAKDWQAFVVWVQRPAKKVPALAELARRRMTWGEVMPKPIAGV
jgi:uncharacterized protein (DUF1778 family)